MEDNLSNAKPDAVVEDVSETALAMTPTSAGPDTPAAPDQRASPAPSSAGSSTYRPYIPQFSAATQMIISRINNKPGSLSAALSSASSVARSIEKSRFEDAKRRLVMKMNTSLTMPIPSLPPRRAGSSNSRPLGISTGDAFQLRTLAPHPPPAPAPAPGPAYTAAYASAPATGTAKASLNPASAIAAAALRHNSAKQKGKAVARGTKRKRGKDDEDASSSLSDLSDSDMDSKSASKRAATKTKSGRHVQKPTQFNPNDAPGSQKRKNYGKRTAEQALCKLCTRGLSPLTNQVVFCDGCNNCWHQLCHEPYIDDEFVKDENRSWFCGSCTSKREKALAKKKTLVEHKGVSWASKTPAQKREYLTDLPHAQLVNIIMYSTELHPDLPIFPGQEPATSTKRVSHGLGGLNAGLSTTYSPSPQPQPSSHGNSRVTGPTNFSSAVFIPDTANNNNNNNNKASSDQAPTTNGKPGAKRKSSAEAQQNQNQNQNQTERESSADSVPPAWPKVGHGVLAGLDLSESDLRDENDYEAFSVTSYDLKGRKVVENGMPV
ncbi:hypothetical protein F5Y17DRAFT_410210 [Xylariaceae sp. FL0594]|nr:hypothetical protein F5Y17DRAFT_410210 [Xylariaceae sp. FL0594]